MNFKIVIALLFLIASFSCGPKEAPQKKIDGINGETVYVYGENNMVDMVFKENYNNKNFAIFIKNDTIQLGTVFKSSIWITNPNYKIIISSPESLEILSKNDHKVEDYEFDPKTEGIYDFKGTIEYDTILVPFEYKFIVVKPKEKIELGV